MRRHTRGEEGEEAAARWLEDRGYKIVSRNYRCRVGELDLVAWQGRTLIFVEVKTRGRRRLGEPAEAVNARKRTHLIRAADHYLLRFASRPPDCRFDIVEVDADGNGFHVRHLPDAFRPRWN